MKRSNNFEPKTASKKSGQIQLPDNVKRDIIDAWLQESQRTPNKPSALSTYKEKDEILVHFYDNYCHRKVLKNKENQPTQTER